VLLHALQSSFMSGFHIACLVAFAVCWLGAAGALALPGKPVGSGEPAASEPATAVALA
jgi:hypothetical protein